MIEISPSTTALVIGGIVMCWLAGGCRYGWQHHRLWQPGSQPKR